MWGLPANYLIHYLVTAALPQILLASTVMAVAHFVTQSCMLGTLFHFGPDGSGLLQLTTY